MSKDYLIERNGKKYEVVIGLEVHAQVLSESKLFSASPTKFGSEPNTQVSLVDAAFPGMLPVINEFCIKQAIKTGIGLNAKINNKSIFDRKNYFYADLPQGYQISQYKDPIVGEGSVVLDLASGTKTIGIERLHLEQDAGKSIHDIDPKNTLVDLNRSGVALMEIVSKPDLRSPEEVNFYIKKLRSIMRYLGTCDGNMQEGSLRADVNVSVRKEGEKKMIHDELKKVCVQNKKNYKKYKKWCDEYFYLPHRKEARGIGGIFFDYETKDWIKNFKFVRELGLSFIDISKKIIKRKEKFKWTNKDKEKQFIKRGRYVEFNLLYDRGTRFGLNSGGNIDSILMSLPPEAKWK
jgi:Asp-tRNA(Asn)/Glu-tRNA(Gln) amidotransferase B subunit